MVISQKYFFQIEQKTFNATKMKPIQLGRSHTKKVIRNEREISHSRDNRREYQREVLRPILMQYRMYDDTTICILYTYFFLLLLKCLWFVISEFSKNIRIHFLETFSESINPFEIMW